MALFGQLLALCAHRPGHKNGVTAASNRPVVCVQGGPQGPGRCDRCFGPRVGWIYGTSIPHQRQEITITNWELMIVFMISAYGLTPSVIRAIMNGDSAHQNGDLDHERRAIMTVFMINFFLMTSDATGAKLIGAARLPPSCVPN